MKKTCDSCGKVCDMLSWETTCYSCVKRKELERMQESILGYEDFLEIYEEGYHKMECPECERTFELETNVSYSWETKKLNG